MGSVVALLAGWLLDLMLGDPRRLPHPVVGFGRLIALGERRLNRGRYRRLKGTLLAVGLVVLVFALAWAFRAVLALAAVRCAPSLPGSLSATLQLPQFTLRLSLLFDILAVFYCLAGTTLIREVRAVFLALDRSLADGRRQVARIVGRDTSSLSAQEVRTAALETLAENLSDGVIAPLFWLVLLGTPGMLAYKMVNTLDSMIGYRTERYRDFGCTAARIDDAANYLPARLTALLMVLPSLLGLGRLCRTPRRELPAFVCKYGRRHASPNSGWPEAALAGILGCRFGGPHYYFGELFDKPYIGEHNRELTTADMQAAVRVNREAEVLMVALAVLAMALWGWLSPVLAD